MKTINVSDQIHEQLLKIQGELQRKTGKRTDMNGVIETLLKGVKP